MNFLDALILGVVEGLTEFLPVSSTGHLILASSLLGLPDSEFLKSFEIAIQSGAIAAVVALYFRSFFDIEIIKRLIAAFIPTAVIGFALYSVVKTYFLGNETLVLAALFLGGIALIVFELLYKEDGDAASSVTAITYKQAAFIGLFQALAMIPGVSRSGATIVGGLLTSGIKRAAIVEFSFLLAVPTMLAATGYDLLKSYSSFNTGDFGILAVGLITSFFVAMAAIVFLLRFIRNHTFISFGIYRIAIALLFWLLIL
ncbi:undecaprenyl-diphosphate phosphatase [Candidatus Kaiserbacteria bacterium]|nr:undecaprenyl-diphosphate phosphatase [Candidatus Kaiserbacteria bacterium]